MDIAIYGRPFEKKYHDAVYKLFNRLVKKDVNVKIYKPFYDYLKDEIKFDPEIEGTFTKHTQIDKSLDFMFSIGGDGTFLESVSYVRNKKIPIIGINIGRLGFLANVPHQEIEHALDAIFAKKHSIENRSLLEMTSSNNMFADFNYALNEITVHKRDTSSMVTIHAYMNDELLNSYWADGLIISTPTGSTAYSLSAGGPIVIPNSNNFVITPIAPHSLAVRPIVVSDNNVLKLKMEGRTINFLASLDYRSEVFDSTVELTIQKADFEIRMVRLPGQSFFSTIRNKLMWGVDKRN